MSENNSFSQSNALFHAIGKTVVRFQQVEQSLSEYLALLLRMREKDDQYLVSAAMSFKQKADLLAELFDRRTERSSHLPEIDILKVRKALEAAEKYRNRVVHSFYAVECSDLNKWLRIKGSLRGRAGFSLNTTESNIKIFEECNEALSVIRDWAINNMQDICEATDVINKNMNGN